VRSSSSGSCRSCRSSTAMNTAAVVPSTASQASEVQAASFQGLPSMLGSDDLAARDAPAELRCLASRSSTTRSMVTIATT